MGWFDDAKDKAEEAADEARRKATEEAGKAAGKAAVTAATTAAKKTVGAFFEGIVSSAEASLEAAQEERGHTGERSQVLDALESRLDHEDDLDGADDETEIADPPLRTGPSIEDRLAAMRNERRDLMASDPVPPPQETNLAPDALGAVAPMPTDPMAKAMAALEAARRARGVDIDAVPEPPPPPRSSDPLAAVDEALAKAAAARAHASSGGRAAQAREQAAREQLAALKSGSARLDSPKDSNDHSESADPPHPSDDGPTGSPPPKKRSL
jgi:hypothetical protein